MPIFIGVIRPAKCHTFWCFELYIGYLDQFVMSVINFIVFSLAVIISRSSIIIRFESIWYFLIIFQMMFTNTCWKNCIILGLWIIAITFGFRMFFWCLDWVLFMVVYTDRAKRKRQNAEKQIINSNIPNESNSKNSFYDEHNYLHNIPIAFLNNYFLFWTRQFIIIVDCVIVVWHSFRSYRRILWV